jgi:hypothetical protein
MLKPYKSFSNKNLILFEHLRKDPYSEDRVAIHIARLTPNSNSSERLVLAYLILIPAKEFLPHENLAAQSLHNSHINQNG